MIPACWPGRAGRGRHWDPGGLRVVLGFTIAHGKIVAIDVLADPERLSRLEAVGVPAALPFG